MLRAALLMMAFVTIAPVTFAAARSHYKLQVYGVRILDGSLKISDVVRVSRDAEVLGEAKLTSLRHFKDQVYSRYFSINLKI